MDSGKTLSIIFLELVLVRQCLMVWILCCCSRQYMTFAILWHYEETLQCPEDFLFNLQIRMDWLKICWTSYFFWQRNVSSATQWQLPTSTFEPFTFRVIQSWLVNIHYFQGGVKKREDRSKNQINKCRRKGKDIKW